jgi:hypothetical protein
LGHRTAGALTGARDGGRIVRPASEAPVLLHCVQPVTPDDDQDPDPREDQPDDAVPDDDAQRRTVVEEPSRDDVEGPFTRTKPSTDRRRDPPQRQ